MIMTKLPFRFFVTEGVATLVLTPQLSEIDWGEVEQVGAEILQQLEQVQPPPHVLIDLSTLDYMGSSQVALIVRVWKSIAVHNRKLVVQVTHPIVLEVLQIAGLHTLWTMVGSRDDALRALGIRSNQPAFPLARAALVCGAVGLAGSLIAFGLSLLGLETIPAHLLRIIGTGLALLGGLAGIYALTVGRHLNRALGSAIVMTALGLALLQFSR